MHILDQRTFKRDAVRTQNGRDATVKADDHIDLPTLPHLHDARSNGRFELFKMVGLHRADPTAHL